MSFPFSNLKGSSENGNVTTKEGACAFPSGNIYIGEIVDNQVHGKGRIEMNGGKYEGEFINGRCLNGRYVYKDELVYDKNYLTENRLLWSERFGDFEIDKTTIKQQ
jgi:hypothetical protein